VSHYRSTLRDIEFNLFEVYRIQDRLGEGPYAQLDEETAREILREVERVASGPFADSFVEGDRTPLQLSDDGDVTLPPGIRASLDAYFDGEWYRLQLPEHLGGYGATPTLNWSATAMLAGANASALLYTAGPFFAAIMDPLLTDEQRERWVIPWVEHRWGGTMVLTEPDAGSDVGAARTTARQADDGTWHLHGTKRFITNGDFDWPDNIIHLVLARAVDADGTPLNGPGTKGLSLFVVPKFWVEPDGSLGARNGVRVAGLEDKMGIKASATCELVFGADGVPARGVLVGDRHDGIRQMFKVIEYARMLVGVKAIETLSTGYRNALAYARERIQGPDLARAADKTSPRVPIIRHPDVRRSLMEQKAHVEGLRALALYAASLQDRIGLLEHRAAAGEHVDADELDGLRRRNDLLLPLVKGYGSEKSFELLADSLQIFGGAGYTRDLPLEQYLRDAKIDTLYEGTTAIQALDLFFRKVARDQGATITALFGEVQALAKGDAGNGALAAERTQLGEALEHTGAMLTTLGGLLARAGAASDPAQAAGDIYRIGLNTTGVLETVAELVVAWLLLRQAEVALAAQAAGDDDPFYEGKIAAARWFVANVLPQFAARREVLERTDLGVMELDDRAW
jgi:alkylation response protein AidB-like acyl-CoA dehydrogenase